MILRQGIAPTLLIGLYAVIGLLVYSDFGISWDESFQHEYGKVTYEYVFDGFNALLEHDSRYHGPFFQFILFATERAAGLTDSAEIFKLRHLLTFLLSVLGVLFFYKLLRFLKFSEFWSTIGLLFFICTPRIFAHSFYNSKDAVFMYLFVVAIYTMLRFLHRPNWKTAIRHALACAILIDVRILGAFVPIFTGILWSIRIWRSTEKIKKEWQLILLYGVMSLGLMVAFWPTLWHNPIIELQNAIARMSAYPWDDPILFEGRFSTPKELPWYYLPKWMLISTPIYIPVLAIVGLLFWIVDTKREPWSKLALLLWLVVPITVILGKGATVYDSWRHIFFLFPALVIMSVMGAERLFDNWSVWRWSKFIPVGFVLLPVFWMVRNHPHHQVYFNPLVRENAWENYEMDYWGLSYATAYEWLLQEVPEGPVELWVANGPGYFNIWRLERSDRERVDLMPIDSATYYISNFRFPNEHNAEIRGEGAYQHPIWMLSVDGNRVCGVYRLKD